MATLINDIDGLAVLTSMGFLVCRDCWRQPNIPTKYGAPIIGKSGRVVKPGDTYSDEICDICGVAIDR